MIARDDILKIIKNHDPNKVLAHDEISIRMAKPCNACLSNPLELLFKSCLENGKFPPEWKKQMRFLHVKKEISKYWKITVPYLCFPLPEKYLKEYCIMNVLELFLKNDLISHSQPGRKPGDSCINQLLLITLKYINNLTMVLMFVVYF